MSAQTRDIGKTEDDVTFERIDPAHQPFPRLSLSSQSSPRDVSDVCGEGGRLTCPERRLRPIHKTAADADA